ncbi:MAG TPA: hypothetical protein H9815_17205 [Candidatus Ruania gallistercoris]|uniref:DUF4203 domain-containing protein n=1 Tax=Candidatus Ruania gallistercoris TaxID=2838746 RepID=A0A9D2EHF3_9MICO|nr:hypothetical protein [Candidatus Ruania gallistercoris]
MTDVIVGVLVLVLGLLLCFRGAVAMRVLLALWGGLLGFGLGAALGAALTDQGQLATALGWVVAIALAVVFGLLAYFFYTLAVVLGFAAMGYVLAQLIATALGASQPWVLITVGLLGGVALGLLAIATHLPELVLIIISALAGASLAVSGLVLLVGIVDLGTWAEAELRIGDQPAWYLGQIALAVAGIIVQVRHSRRRRLGSVRQSWSAPAR